jgi:hypothetical protein
MSMTVIVVLNLVMSLLAIGAVAAGVLIARRLQPVSADEGGRAEWRDPSHYRLIGTPLRSHFSY